MATDSRSASANQGGMQTKKQTAEKQDTGSSAKPSGFGGYSFQFDMQMHEDQEDFMRSPRSQAYLDIIASIDLLSADDEAIIERIKEVVDEETLEEFAEMTPQEIIEELRLCFEEEMAERKAQLQALPKPVELYGIISKCYIDGCDVHAIDNMGRILEHFSSHKPMPKKLAVGREMWREHKGCQCIEVYSNSVRIIAPDGTVETIYMDNACEE